MTEPMNLDTIDIHVHSAEQFVESFDEEANTIYYMMAGRSQPFTNDLSPPKPSSSVKVGYRELFDNFIFGKHVRAEDGSYMIKNNKWVSGQKYDMYDDSDETLHEKRFFVISEEPGGVYSIFKCLYNNKAYDDDGNEYVTEAFDQPLSTETFPGDLHYETADGYVWKIMYKMTRAEYEKFATGQFVPVKQDPEVQAAAVDGSIEKIVITNRGSSYNSYAYGSIRQSSVNGNRRILSIQTDTNLDILTFIFDTSTGSFVNEHSPGQKKNIFFRKSNGSIWRYSSRDVVGTMYLQTATSIRCLIPDGAPYDKNIVSLYQTTNNLSNGPISASAEIVSFRRDLIPNLSSNTDFYNESSFYIRSGKGAGQLRLISEYIVTGNERRIIIDNNFDIEPDATSRFEIGPRITITGDGTRQAKAIATVEESSNSIIAVEIIDSGLNYSYADVRITANTGYIELSGESIRATNAETRAVIGPPGGHGSDVVYELGARHVCMSTEFNPLSQGIPDQNAYRTISLLKDPLFSRLSLNIEENALLFIDGEEVYQDNGCRGEVFARLGNQLVLTNVRGYFRQDQELKTRRANNDIVTTINSIDKSFDVVNQLIRLEIEMTYAGQSATGFLLGEAVFQDESNTTGYVNAVYDDRIDIIATKGVWNVSDSASSTITTITGSTSRAAANVLSQLRPDLIDNTGKIMYVENFQPIERNPDQSEIVKIVLTF